MSHFDLSIAGATLILKDKFPPQLPTRKIYNATYFHDERYRHEIANHYRDYKLRPQNRRRRRRNAFVCYRQPNFEIDNSTEFRDVLPLAVHHFPRFAERVYTPRGRRALCESRPPDETYNATVRRIRAANTCKELKLLVQQQLSNSHYYQTSLNRRRNRISRTCCDSSTNTDGERQQRTKCNNDVVDDDDDNDDQEKSEKRYNNLVQNSKKQLHQQQKQQQRRQRRRRSLGNLESVAVLKKGTDDYVEKRDNFKDRSCGQVSCFQKLDANKAATSNNNNNNDNDDDKFAYYLQLATEHYEKGFLANIKYLESIGERNAIIRRRRSLNSKRHQQQLNKSKTTSVAADATDNNKATTTTTTTSTNSRTESAHSNASISSTTTSTDCQTPTTPRAIVGNEVGFRLTTLLKHIGRKRSFRVGNCCRETFATSKDITTDSNHSTGDWAIRVNITPAITSVKSEAGLAFLRRSSQSNAASSEVTKVSSSTAQSDYIMNDYLNANSQQTNSISHKANKTCHNNSGNSGNTSRAQFHALINHLTQLDISSDIDLSLPKITLTDCSTHNTATAATGTGSTSTDHQHHQSKVASEHESAQLTAEEQENLRKQRSGAFILKQSKFNTSLDIPNEANYHSESRPP